MKLPPEKKVLPAVAVAAALLVAGCCTVFKAQGPLLLHPQPPEKDGYSLNKGGLLYASGSYRVSVRPVDWREMEECRVVTRRGDSKQVDASRHVFFAVHIENRSASPLRFDPARTEAVTEKGAPLPAAGFGAAPFISSAAAGSGLTVDLLASPETAFVPARKTMEGLFVFQVPSRAATTVTLVLEGFRTVQSEEALRFTFEVFPGSADKRR